MKEIFFFKFEYDPDKQMKVENTNGKRQGHKDNKDGIEIEKCRIMLM